MSNRNIFRRFISLEEAYDKIVKCTSSIPIDFEEVPINNSLGAIIFNDIISEIDVPPFDKSLMDGYAVRAQDTFGAEEFQPVKLRLIGRIEMGKEPNFNVVQGTVVEIPTGAPIPKGANAVVMLEYAKRNDKWIEIFRSAVPSENVMEAGADIRTGEIILRQGQRIGTKEIGLLSAIGISRVKVYKKPKVGIISTGDELIAPQDKLKNWKIYDINSSTLFGAVIESGGNPIFMGIVPDHKEKLRKKISSSLKFCDIFLISGSTSAGARDYLESLMNDIGTPGVIIPGISIKPGKPTIVVSTNNKMIFCLPGNPTSALSIFHLLVRPIISRISGSKDLNEINFIYGRLGQKVYSAKGRTELLPVHILTNKKGNYIAHPTYGKSASISSFAMADGFTIIQSNRELIEENEKIKIILFEKNFKPANMVFSGSHCLGLELILSLIRKINSSIGIKSIYVGSLGGVNYIKRNEADIAGIHIFDESTRKYNLPILKKYYLIEKAVIIRGYKREQGYILQRGNPKKIESFEDIIKMNLNFINRNVGSGTRILIDFTLKDIAEKSGLSFKELTSKIDGYHIEAKSHTAVAAAVHQKKADIGIGIRTVAEAYGLDFIPIQDENYDFLVRKESLEKNSVKLFLKVLRSKNFKDELVKYPGLETSKNTGELVTK